MQPQKRLIIECKKIHYRVRSNPVWRLIFSLMISGEWRISGSLSNWSSTSCRLYTSGKIVVVCPLLSRPNWALRREMVRSLNILWIDKNQLFMNYIRHNDPMFTLKHFLNKLRIFDSLMVILGEKFSNLLVIRRSYEFKVNISIYQERRTATDDSRDTGSFPLGWVLTRSLTGMAPLRQNQRQTCWWLKER